MAEHPSIPDYYSARQAAQKLGVSDARIRKLASVYGWECRIVGSDKLFSAADINKYIALRNHLNRLQSGQ